ncbi:hypothetical protein, partial [Brucella anthropi]|uniref:hypothetical protein n=1 Tax=Brucella anthropi TaxID=529 RepID=UPI001AEDBF6F
DVMRCCAAEMAPHRNPPLPPQIQQPKTAGANSKLDKTWGQGQQHFSPKLRPWNVPYLSSLTTVSVGNQPAIYLPKFLQQ